MEKPTKKTTRWLIVLVCLTACVGNEVETSWVDGDYPASASRSDGAPRTLGPTPKQDGEGAAGDDSTVVSPADQAVARYQRSEFPRCAAAHSGGALDAIDSYATTRADVAKACALDWSKRGLGVTVDRAFAGDNTRYAQLLELVDSDPKIRTRPVLSGRLAHGSFCLWHWRGFAPTPTTSCRAA